MNSVAWRGLWVTCIGQIRVGYSISCALFFISRGWKKGVPRLQTRPISSLEEKRFETLNHKTSESELGVGSNLEHLRHFELEMISLESGIPV